MCLLHLFAHVALTWIALVKSSFLEVLITHKTLTVLKRVSATLKLISKNFLQILIFWVKIFKKTSYISFTVASSVFVRYIVVHLRCVGFSPISSTFWSYLEKNTSWSHFSLFSYQLSLFLLLTSKNDTNSTTITTVAHRTIRKFCSVISRFSSTSGIFITLQKGYV